MKQAFLLLIATFFLQCSPKEEKEKANAEFDYLLGSWKKINNQPEKSTFELWEKDESNNYFGFGYTLHYGDTVFKEEMLIIKMKKEWLFEVSGVNDGITPFYITSFNTHSFSCENEFPKRIEYNLINNSLIATISDDSTHIDFTFERILP